MDLSVIKLSRLAITGLVTGSTPSIVLKEIADAHGIMWDDDKMNEPDYRIHFINSINTHKVNIIRIPYTDSDYKLIARFINHDKKWRKGTLERAFDFLMEYTKIEKIQEVHKDFKYGLQTPENPENLNSCILYAICRVNRIDTTYDTTIEEMAANIELLFNLRNDSTRNDYLYQILRHTISDSVMLGVCEGYQLINILQQIDPSKSGKIMNTENIKDLGYININYDELRIVANEILARNQTNPNTRPRNHIEAVVMSAIYFKIDISRVRNPLAEYQELNRSPYYPLDKDMSRRIQLSNIYPDSIENPKLDYIFNPELPFNMYNEIDLDRLAEEEGYPPEEIIIEGSYTLLQTSYLMPTFIHGKQGRIVNKHNTMLDTLDELEYDNVIVYGVRYNKNQNKINEYNINEYNINEYKGGDMIFYSYGELSEVFKHMNRFQKPDISGELFNDMEINKLLKLCRKHKNVRESEECYSDRLELGFEIDRLKLYEEAKKGVASIFINKYENSTIIQQNMVKDALTQLLHCSMYMRGWDGLGPYPLTSEQASPDYDDRYLDIRVTESIAKLDQIIENLNEHNLIGDAFKCLPLIMYNQRSERLLPSTDEEEGLTIYERINIVKGGDSGSIQSCIRISSNRFAATAYYYMTLIGMSTPFDLSQLSHIM
jgi:hypothetical protein